MTREQIVALFAERHEGIRRRDAIKLAGYHAAEGIHESPLVGVAKGRDAIAQVYDAWASGFPDLVPSDEELMIDGDRVVSIIEYRGTDTGGFMGIPATGKPFRLTMVLVCEMKDGEIAASRAIYDFTGLLVQIGVLRTKPI